MGIEEEHSQNGACQQGQFPKGSAALMGAVKFEYDFTGEGGRRARETIPGGEVSKWKSE